MKRTISIGAGLLLAALSGTAGAQVFDIVGLALGMSEDEALAALQAHDASIAITTVSSAFVYSDGVQQLETEPFLAEIQARRQSSGQVQPEFKLLFTPPPEGGRLWAIERREKITANQPSISQYVAALEQKYGKPTAVSPGNYSLSWDFPAGKPRCLARDPQRPGFPTYRPSGDSGNLMGYLQAANQRNPSPPDYKTCGSHLYFILSATDDVVYEFQAIMYDIGHNVAATEAANAAVNALEEQARTARESNGQIPSL